VTPALLRSLLQPGAAPLPPALLGRWEGGLGSFLERYRALLDWLEPPSAYGFLADAYLARAPAQGIRHVEFTVSLGAALRRGRDPRAILGSIAEAAARHRPLVTAAVLVDAVRQFGREEAEATLRAARRCADLAIVVGFGLGGDERSTRAREFATVFAAARDAGLRTTVHAGEGGGPESVRAALEALRPARIAHGIAAARDPELLRRIVDAEVPLDVCIGSNLRTGVVASLAQHPLRALLDAGVRVTLSTDDPGLFEIDLDEEYRLAARLGLEAADLARLADESLRGIRLGA
jgi:adenosine deaminase